MNKIVFQSLIKILFSAWTYSLERDLFYHIWKSPRNSFQSKSRIDTHYTNSSKSNCFEAYHKSLLAKPQSF